MGLKRILKQRIIMSNLTKKGKTTQLNYDEMENYQVPIDGNKNIINSYYLTGHDLLGNSLFVRQAIRGDGKSEVWMYLKLQGKEVAYNHTKDFYDANETVPVSFKCVEVSKKWLVTFDDGNLKIEINFSATSNIYDFTYNSDPKSVASVMSREKWDKKFFAALEENTQIHYEQSGYIEVKGTLGEETIDLKMPSVRDHSYGKREWGYMNQHIWLMALIDENEFLNFSVVTYPHMHDLRAGYYVKDGKIINIVKSVLNYEPLKTINIPDTYAYKVTLENGEEKNVTTQYEFSRLYDFKEYILLEGVGSFDINGVKARGILEFGYNSDETRWESKRCK